MFDCGNVVWKMCLVYMSTDWNNYNKIKRDNVYSTDTRWPSTCPVKRSVKYNPKDKRRLFRISNQSYSDPKLAIHGTWWKQNVESFLTASNNQSFARAYKVFRINE